MEKRIKRYLEYYRQFAEGEKAVEGDADRFREEMLVQIQFFQHERLIHLIVTVTFALLEMIVIALATVSFSISVGLLAIALLILLIPYIRHYYILENEVQKMYGQYDRMEEKRDGGHF